MTRYRRMVVAVVIAALARAASAEWTPPVPLDTPQDRDWIQTTSGEWLKGELLVMYKDELTFDSDELGELTLDWENVHLVATSGVAVIGLTGRRIAEGRLFVEGPTVRVLGDEDRIFLKEEVISITAGKRREANYWDFDLAIGANYRTGNTDQVETTSRARLRRRTVTNRLVFDWLASYNLTDGVVTNDSQRASGIWDLFLSRRFFLTPVAAEWYSDPFQNIANHYALSVAVGYTLIDTPSVDWQVSGGPGYAYTGFNDVVEGEPTSDDVPTFNIGTVYEHEITSRVEISLYYRATFTNQTSGTYLHHVQASLEIDLTRRLELNVNWVWDRIKDPRANSDGTVPESDDLRLVLLLGVSF